YARMEIGHRFVADCTEGLPNVLVSDQLVPLLRDTTYAFADASTVLAEAVQFGLCAFMADVIEGHEDCFYRDFPGLTLGTPEEAIARIKSIEDGSWHYPREQYDELIDRSGTVFFDIMRRDLGLAPRAPVPDSVEEVSVRDL
ncbi:MAG: hypothetical protein K2X44_07290, partial [Magnetospirillum sp.]|nr:hypothetical protein [Magnetospirillum sp.]